MTTHIDTIRNVRRNSSIPPEDAAVEDGRWETGKNNRPEGAGNQQVVLDAIHRVEIASMKHDMAQTESERITITLTTAI